MQINNPLQMNDWGIRKFLKVVLAIQLAIWGVIGSDTVVLQIPILRQFIGFVYLTFVPGIIILRILKLHKLGNIETLLYTVGLSIAALMFTGLFINTVYPLFGISGPISITPLIITISVVVLVLCVLCYIRDKDFSDSSFINVEEILSSPALFLFLIPFLSILGTYLVNFHQNNIILMFLIVILALIGVLIAFDKFIPKNLYPLAVFIIVISLLYHRSLISTYVWGWDIQWELYITNLVKINSIWDPTIYGGCNALLSLVMLAPIYSIISSMEITWVFKIIYPLLFSLVPLGLYQVFQKQTNEKIAFLSCFFFVSFFVFYGEMLQLARQQIAELFLVLLILLMVNKEMDKIKSSFLFIAFGISLAVSHYGLSYIYMFCLISVWLILVLTENPGIQKLKDNFNAKFGRYKHEKLVGNLNSLNIENKTIHSTFVLLFITFTLAWYMYVSSSSAFVSIVKIGDHLVSSIFIEFLKPEAVQGLDIIIKKTASPLHDMFKYLNLLSQFFIIIGILTLILKPDFEKMKFKDEYSAFSLVNFSICFGAIALPHFASSLNTSRLYQIALIFLAPFCVIGGITFFKMLSRVVKAPWTNKSMKNVLKVLSVFFAIFLLFNTGFIFVIANDIPTSFSLSTTVDYPRFNEQEVLGAIWLNGVKGDTIVYADGYRWPLFRIFGLRPGRVRAFPTDLDKMGYIERWQMDRGIYIYTGTLNVVEDKVLISHKKGESEVMEYINPGDIVNGRSRIYANGGAEVYYR